MNKIKSLSVVIPLFKDHKTVSIVYKKFRKIIRKIKIKSEIVFVDDACPFKSGKVLLPYKKHDKSLKVIFHKKNKGYGATLKTGLVNSRYNFIYMTDGDDEYDINNLERFLNLAKKNDLVIGYRKKRNYNFFRKVVSYFYNFLIRKLFKLNFKDVSAGVRIFNKKILNKFNLSSNGPFIVAELIIKTNFYNYRISELGVSHKIRRYGDGSVVNLKNILIVSYQLIKLFFILNNKKK